MKRMRTFLLLSILVFISTLFWPQLLDKQQLLLLSAVSVLLLIVPYLRILAVIPITALYFMFYVNLTLTGQLYPFSQIVNKDNLEMYVDGKDHSIVVQVISLISDGNRGYFKAKLIEVDSNHLNYFPFIEMRWYKPGMILQAGQRHRFIVRLKPIYGRANPAGFDRQKWSYSEHIAYKATIKSHLFIIDEAPSIRARFYEKVKKATDNLQHQGLLLALSFADKSLIRYEKKQLIRNLGISHLFAISGLHIGLLFSVVYLLAQFIYIRILAHSKLGWFSLRLINVSALIGAWGYAYLAGFSLPTQRAFLMLLLAVIIFSLKRKCFKADLLLLVLFAVLLWDPLAVLSLSLWLSFFAVAIILGLLWAFPGISNRKISIGRFAWFKKVIAYVKLLFFLQLGLTLLMLPIQLISFSGLSLMSILINLIAVPLFSLVIIPLVLLGTFITLLYSPLAHILFNISDLIISLFFSISRFANESYHFLSLANEQLLVMLFSLLVLLTFFHFQAHKLRKLSYLFTFFLVCLLSLPRFQHREEWFVEVIDVGQGLAVLLRSNGHILLYDSGARYPSGFAMANSEIVPYLISLGIKQIDHLVISHSDNDHAGGADIIINNFEVINKWAGEPITSNAHFQQCKQGQQWQLGELTVQVLSPRKVTKHNNNNSCVLRISDGITSLLLTGDIEGKQEKILITELGKQLNSDILLAPHHGSRYSSSEVFIERVAPQWVVFSAGFMNHWGFPSAEVMNRYQKQSVKMANTGVSGLIRFQITPQAINMKTFREDLVPYWYHHSFIP